MNKQPPFYQPFMIENRSHEWTYHRLKHIKCSFGKMYFEARVISSILGPNGVTTIQIGWASPDSTEEFERVVLGNHYFGQRIGSVIIHKKPFELSYPQQLITGFGHKNDCIVCSADFEAKHIGFYINGRMVGVCKFPKSFDETGAILVPVIGLGCASVELNFNHSRMCIPYLAGSMSIQECLQIDRGDWVWERGSLVDWNVLFKYGLPMDRPESNQKRDSDSEQFNAFVISTFNYLSIRTLSTLKAVCRLWNEAIHPILLKKSKNPAQTVIDSYCQNTENVFRLSAVIPRSVKDIIIVYFCRLPVYIPCLSPKY